MAKKLTPEQEKLLQEEGEKNKLSKKEIEEIKDLVNVTGGMSEAMKRTLIGVGSALGASAVTALGIFGFEKFSDKHNKPVTPTGETNLPGSPAPKNSKGIANGLPLRDATETQSEAPSTSILSPLK